ncbi:MAG: hypothetical protein IGQ45_05020 [Cyanobacterium sp. T60_A2020_053]|nr:hypothetical protein [Cyanobacterium sp. T60_A2020_053]
MDILPLETLTVEGLTLPQVQQSLCIQCFGKSFQRKSDVPKKFKSKALNLASDLLKEGIESFVTETNFSYTVWAENKAEKAPVKPQSEPFISVSTPENKSFTPSPVTYITSQTNYIPPSPVTAPYQSEPSTVQKSQPDSSLAQEYQGVEESNQEVEQKYRGAVIVDSESPEKNSRMKRKPKTYRGVTYS